MQHRPLPADQPAAYQPSLERLARATGVQLLSYVADSETGNVMSEGEQPKGRKDRRKGNPVTCYFLYELGNTIGVFGKQRRDLCELLIAYRSAGPIKQLTLVEFAGARGFHIKCLRQED